MSARDSSKSPIETPAQPIELGWSCERPELRDSREDWSGITDPAQRRKLQNRLNQRARRERARKRSSRESTLVTERSTSKDHVYSNVTARVGSNSGSQSPQRSEDSDVLAPRRPPPQGCMASVPAVQDLMKRFADHAYASYMQGELAMAHLPLLVRYNLATALATNAALLGVTEEFFRWDGVSPMNKQGPLLGLNFQDQFVGWPVALKPTQSQLSIEHHPWVDCFPWPQLRDNLLKAFEHPDLCDEDELCRDICDYGDADREPMLLIWGCPSDPQSWEVSNAFLKKWAWLLSGCEEVLLSTNHWRAERGEALITSRHFADWVTLSLPKRLSPSET